jgi:V-type H+-transporting ATPase subunit C
MSSRDDDSDTISVQQATQGSEGKGGHEITELWLISAPGDKTCQQTWDTLNNATAKHRSLTANFKFHIPDLKVGTLDTLVGLTEELIKLDPYVESVVHKASQTLADVLENQKDKVKENLLVNGTTPAHYVTHFQWDMAKYPVKQSLRQIADIISKQVTQIDTDLKSKVQVFNNIKGSLQSLERKSTGSLLTRTLHDIVKKEDVVTDSEYMVTLFAVVPLASQKDWWAKYEKLTDMIVPQSSKLITEDSEMALFSVTVFRKVIEDFKLRCRENKFIVRDFQYNEAEVEASRNELTRLTTDKKNQFAPLVRWLKVNFAEAFISWIHVKALRIYVESVLRYGLPVNFQAMILTPPKKMQKKLREVLNQLYAHLDNTSTKTSKRDIVDVPGLNMSSSDYFPYVFLKINISMVD